MRPRDRDKHMTGKQGDEDNVFGFFFSFFGTRGNLPGQPACFSELHDC